MAQAGSLARMPVASSVPQAQGSKPLRVINFEVLTQGCGNGKEIAWVRANDPVVTAQRSFYNGGVDDVRDACIGCNGPGRFGPGGVECLNFAAG